LITIVDEAHGLINPESVGGRAGQFGFATSLGPQAFHIIRSSLLTIFLLDPLQGFRQRENTSLQDIKKWSNELGAGDAEEISLEGTQFRCAGSAEYVTWIESILSGASIETNRQLAKAWRLRTTVISPAGKIVPFPAAPREGELVRAAETSPKYGAKNRRAVNEGSHAMQFQIFQEPESWEAALREQSQQGNSVRVLASYCRK
jgi:hypothetical protein